MIFYQDDYAAVHLGDARQILKELPESSVDMGMTSPPYLTNPPYCGIIQVCGIRRVNLLKVCILIWRLSSKWVNTGVLVNHIGIKSGSLPSMFLKDVLRVILHFKRVAQKLIFCFGFIGIISPAVLYERLEVLNIGDKEVRLIQCGKVVHLVNGIL